MNKSLSILFFLFSLGLSFASNLSFAADIISDEKLGELGIDPTEVKLQFETPYGVTSIYVPNIGLLARNIILTDKLLYVVTDDERGIEITMPLSKIKSVELRERSSFLGKGITIDAEIDLGIMVFNFNSTARNDLARKFYSALVMSGIKEATSTVVKDNYEDGRHRVRTLLPPNEQVPNNEKIKPE